MATKRYQITLAPFIGLNGKMSQSSQVCRNMPDSDRNGVKFYFGSYKVVKNKAYFALRERSRNLNDIPYTNSESLIKQYFVLVQNLVKTNLENPDKYQDARKAYADRSSALERQMTFRGFVFSKVWKTSNPQAASPSWPF